MTSIPAVKFWRKIGNALGWTRSSYILLSGFIVTCGLIVYIWWPLAEEYLALVKATEQWWRYIDWLLIGNFVAMSLLIMAGADLKTDLPIVLIGLAGGLVIESWGTQTLLWTYYTNERPPLWIIPAWPIASLSIDRLVRLMDRLIPAGWGTKPFAPIYVLIFASFAGLMIPFVWWTRAESMTITALALCAFLILTPTHWRIAALTFLAGSGLGYFLEVWGTTRLCWTYYTGQRPPVFAVLAHGMAAVAFWRVRLLYDVLWPRLTARWAGAQARGDQAA
jgi:hypothetical protein